MPELGKTIGRYLIDRPLGQGAMGTVYLAEDPLLKRRVAIKVVRAAGDERIHALSRFQREAEISAQLNHPNIVTIYDVGEEPGVGPFLAMEYVEGSSLGQLIREGTLETETKFAILIQTMRALRAAHMHAIVHRDIKPENILVAENGRAMLMDFGIAKTMAPQSTHPGEFLGSPAYSAPELLRGAEPTPSSDRYAFSVTAFELLTGLMPHPGVTVASVITHILMEPPVFPPGMSGDTAKVFRQALAQDPDERPLTLMEFLVPLVDAWPMEPVARDRVRELFRHDDYAGDIQPLRRLRASSIPGSAFATDPGSGGLAVDGRGAPARPAPSLPQAPTVKIQLGEDPALQHLSAQGRRPRPGWRPRPVETPLLTPMRLVKWILAVLILGPLFWWVYSLLVRPN
jgi:serine/threonine-protein kinase